MKPTVAKGLLTLVAAILGALPYAFPILQPFAPIFAGIAGALAGGGLIPRPGDAKVAS